MDFINWRKEDIHKKSDCFISDGIIDEELWNKSKIKILYIFKEAYNSDTGDFDLRNHLSKPLSVLRKKMWWTVSQWTYGVNKIIEGVGVVPFDENFKKNQEMNKLFHSIAIINIKKSSGKTSSNSSDLAKYVEADWDHLKEEIDEINPDLIIGGSTWPLIQDKFDSMTKEDEWLYKADGRYYVDFWHPANQYPNKLNYYSLITVLNNSKDKWWR